MTSRGINAAAVIILAIALPACSSRSTNPDQLGAVAGSLGRCDAGTPRLDEATTDAVPLSAELLSPTLAWAEVSNLVSRQGQVRYPGHEPMRAEGLTLITGELPSGDEVDMPSISKRRLTEVPDGSRYFAALRDSALVLLASVDADGQIAFVGDCLDGFTRLVNNYAAASRLRPEAVLRGLARNGAGSLDDSISRFVNPAAQRAPGFTERQPMSRQLVASDPSVPPELLERLRTLTITFSLPEALQRLSADGIAICARTPDAWTDCFALSADRGRTIFTKSVQHDPEATLELWLAGAGSRNAFDRPYGRLLTVPANSDSTKLSVTAAPGIASVEDLIRNTEAGKPALVLAD